MCHQTSLFNEAEKNGFITELGAWIIKQACQDFATITSTIRTLESISVNISPKQLMKRDFLTILDNALETTGMYPKNLELEITENSLMDESSNTLELLDELKRREISIALDDFGTGYSSLSYLTKYPIDTLKIDRSIIINANQDSPALKVLRNVFMLAHSLEMQVVAEGVETLEQLKLLEEYQEDLIQGYLFCKPLPMNDLVNFYHQFTENNPPRNDL